MRDGVYSHLNGNVRRGVRTGPCAREEVEKSQRLFVSAHGLCVAVAVTVQQECSCSSTNLSLTSIRLNISPMHEWCAHDERSVND
jgi:hypothetical protein